MCQSVVLAGLGFLLASGCGERGRYEREAAGSVESTVAEDSGLEDAEDSTESSLSDFDLEALMSRCWSSERRITD